MSFNKTRRVRDPFGPRFGELMGKHCHQALTAAARGKREEFDALVKDLYQMLDSIETDTVWPEEKKKDEPTPTPVAPKAKPAKKDPGNKKPAAKRNRKATDTGDGFGDEHGGV